MKNFDSGHFRRTLGRYPTGVCVITSMDDAGAPVGMVVGSFTSVSLAPPLVAFFPDRNSSTWPIIERAGHFCVNILSHDQVALCGQLAARGGDRFRDISFSLSGQGAPVLEGIAAWIDCRIHSVSDAGDHFIVMGEVVALESCGEAGPLLFHGGRYHGLALLDA